MPVFVTKIAGTITVGRQETVGEGNSDVRRIRRRDTATREIALQWDLVSSGIFESATKPNLLDHLDVAVDES